MISSWSCRRRCRRTSGRTAASSSMPACRASRRSARRPSCTARRSWIRPKRRSATTGSIRRTSASASSPPASCSTGSKLEVSRFNAPRARPAPLEHRDRAARIRPRSGVSWNPTRTLVAAGQLGPFQRSRAARARRRPEAAGRRARSTRARSRPAGSSRARSPGAARSVEHHNDDALRRRSVAQARRLDAVRARRNDREPRAFTNDACTARAAG